MHQGPLVAWEVIPSAILRDATAVKTD